LTARLGLLCVPTACRRLNEDGCAGSEWYRHAQLVEFRMLGRQLNSPILDARGAI
jgi:hypothetical protein